MKLKTTLETSVFSAQYEDKLIELRQMCKPIERLENEEAGRLEGFAKLNNLIE